MAIAQAVGEGRKVVAASATAEKLSSTPVQCAAVCIMAETDNTGLVVVGGSTVVAALATRKGVALAAGQSLELNVSSLDSVWLDVTVNGDGVTYTYIN